MKRFSKVFFYSGLVALVASGAEAQEARTRNPIVDCPVVASRHSKEFQSLPRKDFICYRSSAGARAGGYKRGDFVSESSKFVTTPDYEVEGVGEANTPAFRVRKNPTLVEYQYDGTGFFRIDVIDRGTGNIVDRLVNSHGAVSSQTYINQAGVFYLRISGDATEPRNSDANPSWTVSFDTRP